MEISILLFQKIFSLFLMLFMGILLVKSGLLTVAESKSLSVVSLYLITPCVILSSFQIESTPEVRQGLLLALLAAVIVHIVLILSVRLLTPVLHLSRVEQVTVIYSNAGSLIIPIIASIMGPEWVAYTSPFIAVQLFLIWSHAKMVLSGSSGIELEKVLKNINMVFIFIGIILFFSGIRFPAIVMDAVRSVGDMIGPLTMIVTGLLVGSMSWKKALAYRRAWLITFLRLVFFPLIILAILKYSGLSHLAPDGRRILLVTLLAAITPSSGGLTQMAMIYCDPKDSEYASVINVVTTLLCIITMPMIVAVYQI